MALIHYPETEKAKSNPLNQYGKKSFWVFAALLLHSVISAVLITYSTHEPASLSANDSWVAPYIWPMLLRLTFVFFALSFIPCVFYVIANTVRNTKVAHAFLVLGLVYHVLLFMTIVLPNILFILNIPMLFLFLIPLCGYLVLFYKATHGSK